MHPRDREVEELFNRLGIAVPTATAEDMARLQIRTLTAMMRAYYGLLRTYHLWLVAEGVDSETASTFTDSLLYSMAVDGKRAGVRWVDRGADSRGV